LRGLRGGFGHPLLQAYQAATRRCLVVFTTSRDDDNTRYVRPSTTFTGRSRALNKTFIAILTSAGTAKPFQRMDRFNRMAIVASKRLSTWILKLASWRPNDEVARCWIQRADFSTQDYAAVDVSAAVRAFDTHPWRDELTLTQARARRRRILPARNRLRRSRRADPARVRRPMTRPRCTTCQSRHSASSGGPVRPS
jgi:hypothetical protein